MPRRLRVEAPGGVYHITSRGNNRAAIYVEDEDRVVFRALYQKTVVKFGWIPHAYCLMTNHFHLVITTPLPTLSRGMQFLKGRYAEYFNVIHGRTGHVFEGRFRSTEIESDEHFADACQYVLWNPVAAGLCDTPEE